MASPERNSLDGIPLLTSDSNILRYAAMHPPKYWWGQMARGTTLEKHPDNSTKEEDIMYRIGKKFVETKFQKASLVGFNRQIRQSDFLSDIAQALYATFRSFLWTDTGNTTQVPKKTLFIRHLRCFLASYALHEIKRNLAKPYDSAASHRVIVESLRNSVTSIMGRLHLPYDNRHPRRPTFEKGHPAEDLYEEINFRVKIWQGNKNDIKKDVNIFAEDADELFDRYAPLLWKDAENNADRRSQIVLDIRCWLAVRANKMPSQGPSQYIKLHHKRSRKSSEDATEENDHAGSDSDSPYRSSSKRSTRKRITTEKEVSISDNDDTLMQPSSGTLSRKRTETHKHQSSSMAIPRCTAASPSPWLNPTLQSFHASLYHKLLAMLHTREGNVGNLGFNLISPKEFDQISTRLGNQWLQAFDTWGVWESLNTQLEEFRVETGFEGSKAYQVSLTKIAAFRALKNLQTLGNLSQSKHKMVRLYMSNSESFSVHLVSFVAGIVPSCDEEVLSEAFREYNEELLAWFK